MLHDFLYLNMIASPTSFSIIFNKMQYLTGKQADFIEKSKSNISDMSFSEKI